MVWPVIETSSEIASGTSIVKVVSSVLFSLVFNFTAFILSISDDRLRFIVLLFNSKILEIIGEFSNVILSVIILVISHSRFSFLLLSIRWHPLRTTWRSVSQLRALNWWFISKESLRVTCGVKVVLLIGCLFSKWCTCGEVSSSGINALRISHVSFSIFNSAWSSVIIIFLVGSVVLISWIIIWNASISLAHLGSFITSGRDGWLRLRSTNVFSKLSLKSELGNKVGWAFELLMIYSVFIASSKLFIFRLIKIISNSYNCSMIGCNLNIIWNFYIFELIKPWLFIIISLIPLELRHMAPILHIVIWLLIHVSHISFYFVC